MSEESESMQQGIRQLAYIHDYLTHGAPNDVARYRAQLDLLLANPSWTALSKLYAEVAAHEPAPATNGRSSGPSRGTGLPALALERSLGDALTVQADARKTTAYLDGISIVSYAHTLPRHIGHHVRVGSEDLPGTLIFHADFFRNFRPAARPRSAMRNVAKAFFSVNDRLHVALVQYLHPEGTSGEHYHSSEEWIIQLAGESYVESRPIDNDTLRAIAQLHPGAIHHIPPAHQHRLYTLEEGSITIPIKPLTGRQDHHYQTKSAPRIAQELDALLQAHYESGHGLQEELEAYALSLTAAERMRFEALVRAERTGAIGRHHAILQSLLR